MASMASRSAKKRSAKKPTKSKRATGPSIATADGGKPDPRGPSVPRIGKKTAPPGTLRVPADPAARAAGEIARQLLKAYGYVEVSAEAVLAEARTRGLVVSTLAELREQPLAKRDALQTTFVKSAKIWATSHGTTLGSAGIMTMAADVAALVAVNLRMVQQIALSYGVEPAPERVDGWALLLSSLGGSADPSEVREVSGSHAKELAARLLEDTALTFARRLGKQAGRAVPIVGAVFGGLSNYAYTAEVGTRARAFYRDLAP